MRLMGLRDFHTGTLPADSKGRKRKTTFSAISGHQFPRKLEQSCHRSAIFLPFQEAGADRGLLSTRIPCLLLVFRMR